MRKPKARDNAQLPLGDPVRNCKLFAPNFLEHRLADLPEWQAVEGLEETFGKVRSAFEAAASHFTDSTNEAQTEHDLIQPLLDILWGHDCYQVQTGLPNLDARGRPDYAFFLAPAERTAAEKHANAEEYWRDVPCLGDAKRWSGSLDREVGAGESPSAQIARYLYRAGVRWGILTNGRVWRLYEQDRSRAGGTFYEVNLEALICRNDHEAFRHFLLFFRREAFVPDASGKTFLDKVLDGSVEYATEVGREGRSCSPAHRAPDVSAREIKGKVADVPQATPVDQDAQEFSGILPRRISYGGLKLMERGVVGAVEVSGAEGNRCQSGGERLHADRDELRGWALPVADQIEGLGADVLRAIAADRPLARDAGQQDRLRFSEVRGPQGGKACDGMFHVYKGCAGVDLLVSKGPSRDHYVGRENVVGNVAQKPRQLSVVRREVPVFGRVLLLSALPGGRSCCGELPVPWSEMS